MRIRTIKPEFFQNDQLAEVSPLGRLLFIGLWGLADRRGRLFDRPKRIKAAIFPYEEADVESLLGDLERRGFIVRYQAGESRAIQVVTFERHQRITGKESETESEISPPADGVIGEALGKQRGSIGETTGKHPGNIGEATETTGREGKGKEGKGTGKDVLSGKPAVAPGGRGYHPDARTVLHLLNEATGKHFREVDANLSTISARLKEPDVDLEGVRAMIARQCARWKADPKMCDYLRPATLFGKEKFDGYYAARNLPVGNDKPESNQRNHRIGDEESRAAWRQQWAEADKRNGIDAD